MKTINEQQTTELATSHGDIVGHSGVEKGKKKAWCAPQIREFIACKTDKRDLTYEYVTGAYGNQYGPS